MKKNKALTAAISVLSLTMVSMCAIGGTFAKYTTNDSGSDTATVATWGVNVVVEGEATAIKDTFDSNAEAHVKTNTGELMAPGTKGNLAKVTLSGTPEVDVEVTYTPTLTLAGWTLEDSSQYCPLVFTVGTTDCSIGGALPADFTDTVGSDNKITDQAELKAAVEHAISKLGATYAAGTDLSTASKTSVISWSWAFEGENEKDTELANKATLPSVTLDLTVTATQVD